MGKFKKGKCKAKKNKVKNCSKLKESLCEPVGCTYNPKGKGKKKCTGKPFQK